MKNNYETSIGAQQFKDLHNTNATARYAKEKLQELVQLGEKNGIDSWYVNAVRSISKKIELTPRCR